LQRISLANTALALAAAPAIIWFTDISYVSRVGLATSLALFGLLTTGKRDACGHCMWAQFAAATTGKIGARIHHRGCLCTHNAYNALMHGSVLWGKVL
jgi:hypothetical protein